MHRTPPRQRPLISVCHFAGTLATNLSYIFLSASLIQVLKTLEPPFTMVLDYTLNRREYSVTQLVAVSLVVIGVALTSFASSSFNGGGLLFALISSFAFPVRNVLSKQDKLPDRSEPWEVFLAVSIACFWVQLPFWIAKVLWYGFDLSTSGILAAFLFASYQTFSFGFLSLTTAVTHSVVNVFKRAFTLTISVLVLDRSLPSDSFTAGLLVMFAGLVLYNHKNFVALKYENMTKGVFVSLSFAALFFVSVRILKRDSAKYTSETDTIEAVFVSTDTIEAVLTSCVQGIQRRTIELFVPTMSTGQTDVLLVDPSYHSNIGDVMLTYGELCLFRELGIQSYTECGVFQSEGRNDDCKFDEVNSSSLAVWQAGGNWGDLYYFFHKKRLDSIKILMERNVTVVGMPQSLHYKSTSIQRQDAAEIDRYTESGSNMSLY